MRSTDQSGFIALTSVIIISALLIVIGSSLGYTGFFSRFNILDGEFKQTSLALAEACAEIARVEIANNPGFAAVNRSYDIGANTCKILSVSAPVSGVYTVQSQGEVQNSISNIEAKLKRDTVINDVTVNSWIEKGSF